ncbi:hypothetical protein D3C85_1364760 [compost metagenome]
MLRDGLTGKGFPEVTGLPDIDPVGRSLVGLLERCGRNSRQRLGEYRQVDALVFEGEQHVAKQIIRRRCDTRRHGQGVPDELNARDRLYNGWSA